MEQAPDDDVVEMLLDVYRAAPVVLIEPFECEAARHRRSRDIARDDRGAFIAVDARDERAYVVLAFARWDVVQARGSIRRWQAGGGRCVARRCGVRAGMS